MSTENEAQHTDPTPDDEIHERPVAKHTAWHEMSFDVLWKSSLVQFPRMVPDSALKFTSSAPHPFRFKLPSRDAKRTIDVLVTVPETAKADQPMPVMFDFHGGGFTLGSTLEDQPWCSKVSRECDALVLNVDYRLAPTYSFPAAIEDQEDVMNAVLDPETAAHHALINAIRRKTQKQLNIDSKKIAVSGFSSGGNMALNSALSVPGWSSVIPDDLPNPIPLLLFYPSFDARLLPSQRTRPAKMGPIKQRSYWPSISNSLVPTYLARNQTSMLRASPGLADVNKCLHKQSKMLLILPEIDTLAEQSEAWVEAVAKSNFKDVLEVRRIPDTKHGWTQFPDKFLSPTDLKTKYEEYNNAIRFLRSWWYPENATQA